MRGNLSLRQLPVVSHDSWELPVQSKTYLKSQKTPNPSVNIWNHKEIYDSGISNWSLFSLITVNNLLFICLNSFSCPDASHAIFLLFTSPGQETIKGPKPLERQEIVGMTQNVNTRIKSDSMMSSHPGRNIDVSLLFKLNVQGKLSGSISYWKLAYELKRKKIIK